MTDTQDETKKTISFFYLKNPSFRVIHVDGALGGITPRGLLHMATYSERPAIPQMTTHDVDEAGKLGPVGEMQGREGIVREMDIDLIMNRQAAVEVRDWLTRNIDALDKMNAKNGDRK